MVEKSLSCGNVSTFWFQIFHIKGDEQRLHHYIGNLGYSGPLNIDIRISQDCNIFICIFSFSYFFFV